MVQYRTKKASYPKCPVTGQRLAGIKALRPAKYSNKRMSKRQKTINRAYGGCLSHGVVRERIVRAFLLEERKIVKKVCLLLGKVLQRRNLITSPHSQLGHNNSVTAWEKCVLSQMTGVACDTS